MTDDRFDFVLVVLDWIKRTRARARIVRGDTVAVIARSRALRGALMLSGGSGVAAARRPENDGNTLCVVCSTAVPITKPTLFLYGRLAHLDCWTTDRR